VQAIDVWVVFVVLAIINEAAREIWYGAVLGNELLARQISTVTGISLFLAAMYVFFKKTSAEYTEKDFLVIGGMWGGMYHCLRVRLPALRNGGLVVDAASRLQHSCGERLWGFVLLTIFAGPLIVGRYLLRKGR